MISVGPLDIDQNARRVWIDKQEVDLTRTEFDLLATIAADPARAHKKMDLLVSVWDYPNGALTRTRTLDAHISHLRKKMGKCWFQCVRSYGYRLCTPTDLDRWSA